MICRHCYSPLSQVFLDLGHAPPSNAYVNADNLRKPEVTYPLRVYVCSLCKLVQTEDHAEADQLFTPEYAYFSSTSKSWVEHAASYSRTVTQRFGLTADS